MQGHLFIDRDPQHFGLILNYLRDGFAVLPRDEAALREIMIEASFYQVGRCWHVGLSPLEYPARGG